MQTFLLLTVGPVDALASARLLALNLMVLFPPPEAKTMVLFFYPLYYCVCKEVLIAILDTHT